MEHPDRRRGLTPWIWVLIVLAAIVLVLVVWWAVAAQNPPQTVVVPGGQTTTPPTNQPTQPQPAQQPQPKPAPSQTQQPQTQQPVVVQRNRPVNIYISPEKQQPKVITVPQGQQLPQAQQRYRQLNLPDQFKFNGKLWQPSGQTATSDSTQLKDTGMNVSGNVVYAPQDAQPPYDTLYLETEPGSGIYIVYTPSG